MDDIWVILASPSDIFHLARFPFSIVYKWVTLYNDVRYGIVVNIGYTVRMNNKGQIVVPKKLREWLGVKEGDEITFLDARNDRIDTAKINIRIIIPGR